MKIYVEDKRKYVISLCTGIKLGLPIPLRLPKLLDLSDWELLLVSPAEPDFTLFPFSRKETNRSRSRHVNSNQSRYQHPRTIKADWNETQINLFHRRVIFRT